MRDLIRAVARRVYQSAVPPQPGAYRRPADRIPAGVQLLAPVLTPAPPPARARLDITLHPELPPPARTREGPHLTVRGWPQHVDMPLLIGHFDIRPYVGSLERTGEPSARTEAR